MNRKNIACVVAVGVLTFVLLKVTYPFIRHEPIGNAYALVISLSGAFGYSLALRLRARKRSSEESSRDR